MTEPRTAAGRALWRREMFDLDSEEDRRRLALAIEQEAARPTPEPAPAPGTSCCEACVCLVQHGHWHVDFGDLTDLRLQRERLLARVKRLEAAPADLPSVEPDWNRLGYVLSLIGPVDVADDDEGWIAYTEHIRARYREADLESDPAYARLARLRGEQG